MGSMKKVIDHDKLSWYHWIIVVLSILGLMYLLSSCKKDNISPKKIDFNQDHFSFNVYNIKATDNSKSYFIRISEAIFNKSIGEINQDGILYYHNNDIQIDTLQYRFIIYSENCIADVDFYIYGKQKGTNHVPYNSSIVFKKPQ